MITTIFSSRAPFLKLLGGVFLAIALATATFLEFSQPDTAAGIPTEPLPPSVISIATSTPVPVAQPAPPKIVPKPVVIPKVIPKAPPVVIAPPPVSPPVSTSTPPITIGTTTLAVQRVPLLSGGTARAGTSVPISYLQITNIGTEGALLKGFWVRQNGSAPGELVTGLSTVDDKGGSRGFTQGTTTFQNGVAFAPTRAIFAPGQMRLFTIKATVTQNVYLYAGTQLMIDVSSIESAAAVQGQFPIRGTTWTIAQ